MPVYFVCVCVRACVCVCVRVCVIEVVRYVKVRSFLGLVPILDGVCAFLSQSKM